MKALLIISLFSLNAWSVETEQEKLLNKLVQKTKGSEVLEVIEGVTQDRRYRIVSNTGGRCRAESLPQWNETKKIQSLIKVKQICLNELNLKYPDLKLSGEAYCHDGIIFSTDSEKPVSETRYYLNNSKEDLSDCYTVYDPTYMGDYDIYFSAIMRRNKR